ncbi:MAG: hypothetical protein QG611_1437, partial [Bacteroidota bacterium]|nr:hypothetical protein [Bacteroidota bacterium]
QVSAIAQRIVVVKDENGNPVQGAIVTVGEGAKSVLTNERGEFTLRIENITPLLIEAEGFDSRIITAYPAVELNSIEMIKPPVQMSSKDNVNIPFGSFKKRHIPGAVAAINTRDLLVHDQSEDFRGAIRGSVPGFFGSSNNRGLGAPLVIVDGVPRSGADYNLQMIDQISVQKDLLTSMLYGGQARNGVIYITTKRGEPLKKILNFTFESGLNKPISYPKYLSSAEYMELYNEALDNDELPVKYSQAVIDNTISGLDPVRYPDENYYNSTYLKDFSSYYNFVGEASGGNQVAQYYLNVGWRRNTGLIKIGEGDNEKTDRLNIRGNIDYKLNNVLKIRFDAAVIFNIQNQPRGTITGSDTADFWKLSTTLYPNTAPVLIPATLMKDQTLLGAAQLVDDKYLLGGTSEYQNNIYGELTRNGPTQGNDRLLEMNIGLDFDLNSLTRGLTASLFFTYDLQSIFRTDILNTYAVYQPIYADDTITSWSKTNVDLKVNTQTLSDVSFSRRNGLYGKADYHRGSGDHEINATAMGYFDQSVFEGVLQPTKHINFGVCANYNYKKKYIAELTGVVSGSVKLHETSPWGISPGLGLGWIVTEESFLENNSRVNYLKLRANWALMNSDEGLSVYNAGHNIYNSGSTFYYYHSAANNKLFLVSLGNPNLGFEKRSNFTFGFDGITLNSKLRVEATYFYYKDYDEIVQRINTLPLYYGSNYYENFESHQYQGAELGLSYTESFGDLIIKVGSNFVYAAPKALIVDELNYEDDYRKITGKPTDARFGFVALGLFKDQNDIYFSVPQSFGTVKPGDITYKDLNNDNIIDDQDQKMIGHSHSRVEYSFNVSLQYKAFELFALGTGQTGMSSYFNNDYYWVYGTKKYSEVVLNRWTEETASTATYPRLTTLSNEN